jgi:chromosome partitioning protein
MSHIIAVANQKGGVAKTTTAVSLAAGLARFHDKKVLLIDLDPQANATLWMPIPEEDYNKPGIYELLNEEVSLPDAVRSFGSKLSIIPSHIKLARLEPALTGALDAYRLKEALAQNQYDYVVLDCPPSLGALTLNALVAATHVVVPVKAAFFGLSAVDDFMETTQMIRQRLNPSLSIVGILLTLHNEQTTIAKDVTQVIREKYGDLLFRTSIGVNVKLDEAASAQKSIFVYDAQAKGALEYKAFVAEVVERVE